LRSSGKLPGNCDKGVLILEKEQKKKILWSIKVAEQKVS
jgi:hypothetical protein